MPTPTSPRPPRHFFPSSRRTCRLLPPQHVHPVTVIAPSSPSRICCRLCCARHLRPSPAPAPASPALTASSDAPCSWDSHPNAPPINGIGHPHLLLFLSSARPVKNRHRLVRRPVRYPVPRPELRNGGASIRDSTAHAVPLTSLPKPRLSALISSIDGALR